MQIFHFDFNHQRLRREVVRELLTQVAALGYDTILWELENQVVWESCPECATAESWSKEEFSELLSYARSLGLQSIPLLQTIGHGEYVMAHERYHALREHPDFSDCYCVSNPETRALLKRWIGEYRELFGELRYFHLGGDEAYRFGICPRCKERQRMELYGEHIGDLAQELLAAGIRPGVWGDMLLAEADDLEAIPRDFVIWDWDYSCGITGGERVHVWGHGTFSRPKLPDEILQRFPEMLDENGTFLPFYTARFLKNRGYDVILCSSARSAMDGLFLPNSALHAANIVGAELAVRRDALLGHCVTSWAIRLNPLRASLPLLALPALMAETPQGSLDGWKREAALRFFGFVGGFEAADLMSNEMFHLRHLSAVQWSGLKDSRPAPQGWLHKRLARWQREGNVWWSERHQRVAELLEATKQALVLLEPYQDTGGVTALWLRGGRLQCEYLELLREFLEDERDPPHFWSKLSDFTARLAAFYAEEQAPLSARHNAELVTAPLIDATHTERAGA